MRFHRNQDDFELQNEAEIEAALQDAINGPIDRLLAIEEFVEKTEPQLAETVESELPNREADWCTEEDQNAQTLAFPAAPSESDESHGRSSRAA